MPWLLETKKTAGRAADDASHRNLRGLLIKKMIRIWKREEAPKKFRALCKSDGVQDWLALVSAELLAVEFEEFLNSRPDQIVIAGKQRLGEKHFIYAMRREV